VAVASPAGDALYASARAELAAGNADAAMTKLLETVRVDPRHGEAWRLLGDLRYAKEDKRGALDAYEHALEIDPGDATAKSRAFVLRSEVGGRSLPGTPRAVRLLWVGAYAGEAFPSLSPPRHVFERMVTLEVEQTGMPATVASTWSNARYGGGFDAAFPFRVGGSRFGLYLGGDYYRDARLTVRGTGVDPFGDTVEDRDDWSVSFGGLLVGAHWEPVRWGGAYARLGVLAEFSFLHALETSVLTGRLADGTVVLESVVRLAVQSSGVGGGGEVEAGYEIAGRLALFVRARYMAMRFGEVTLERPTDTDGDGAIDQPTGRVVTDERGAAVPFTVTGGLLSVGLRLGF
jgi:hypothetical protein